MQMYSGLDSAFPRHLSFENGDGSEFFQYIFVTKFFFLASKCIFWFKVVHFYQVLQSMQFSVQFQVLSQFGRTLLRAALCATLSQCLKITEKVSFNIASEASYVYILSGQKLTKNAKNGPFWRVFENLKFAGKQCYQTGQF